VSGQLVDLYSRVHWDFVTYRRLNLQKLLYDPELSGGKNVRVTGAGRPGHLLWPPALK
jgi:hypothetical protein